MLSFLLTAVFTIALFLLSAYDVRYLHIVSLLSALPHLLRCFRPLARALDSSPLLAQAAYTVLCALVILRPPTTLLTLYASLLASFAPTLHLAVVVLFFALLREVSLILSTTLGEAQSEVYATRCRIAITAIAAAGYAMALRWLWLLAHAHPFIAAALLLVISALTAAAVRVPRGIISDSGVAAHIICAAALRCSTAACQGSSWIDWIVLTAADGTMAAVVLFYLAMLAWNNRSREGAASTAAAADDGSQLDSDSAVRLQAVLLVTLAVQLFILPELRASTLLARALEPLLGVGSAAAALLEHSFIPFPETLMPFLTAALQSLGNNTAVIDGVTGDTAATDMFGVARELFPHLSHAAERINSTASDVASTVVLATASDWAAASNWRILEAVVAFFLYSRELLRAWMLHED